jgi:hypothetical protein
MPFEEDLPDINEGDPLSAEGENRLRQIVRRGFSGEGFYSDSAGVIQYGGAGVGATSGLFCKVDSEWTSGSATVSVWKWSGSAWVDSGVNKTVYMPPWISSWTVAAGTWVELKYHAQSRRWYATPMVSQATITDWQYNATSDDIEEKTRTIVGPFTNAESDWTKVDDTNPCA